MIARTPTRSSKPIGDDRVVVGVNEVGGNLIIDIDLTRQRLCLRSGAEVLFECPVSCARNGPGEESDSECTPRGWHEVHAKIGDGCAPNTVFIGRVPTGETYCEELASSAPERDWILTRILWLTGREPGVNLGGAKDTLKRYIYLHGCPDDTALGKPGSHGCIRISNDDIVRVFDRVSVGTPVYIHE